MVSEEESDINANQSDRYETPRLSPRNLNRESEAEVLKPKCKKVIWFKLNKSFKDAHESEGGFFLAQMPIFINPIYPDPAPGIKPASTLMNINEPRNEPEFLKPIMS